jgi:MFS family permease
MMRFMAVLASVKRRLHYGWAIFGLTFTNLTVEGGSKNTQAVFLVALQNSFMSSATATSAIFSVGGLVGAFSTPILGRLLDRMGPRFLFPIAGALILAGWLASSFATELWHLFIFYSVIATLGQTALSSFSATANLAPWFPRTRGGMLGLADAGNPAGQAIFTPLAQVMVSTIGWRSAYQILGVVFFILVGPINYLFQRRPPLQNISIEEGQAGAAAILAAEPSSEGQREVSGASGGVSDPMTLREILKRPSVWLLLLTRAANSTASQMTQLHMVAFFILAGYGELQAAVTIGLVGLLSIGGRPIFGSLSDFIGRETTYAVGLGMTIGSIVVVLLFGNGSSLWPLALFVALAGLSDGVSGLVVGAKAADLFPSNTLGTVMGVVEVGRGVGIALGPILGGLLFDLQGDYLVAFSLAAGLTFAAICFMWAVRFTTGEARY